jgi:transcriptional regulator with XRE-family HTH domain
MGRRAPRGVECGKQGLYGRLKGRGGEIRAREAVINTKELRTKLNLTPEQFALLTGVGVRQVYRWENGSHKPTGAAVSIIHVLDFFVTKTPDKLEVLNAFIQESLVFGGLSNFLFRLMDLQFK